MRSDNAYVGLFPAFDEPGGVQASGRLAWDAITRAAGPSRCTLITYGGARLPTVRAWLSSRVGAGTRVVVWHIDLLKLLWLPPRRRATVALFLHGIEAFRRFSAVERRLLDRVQLFMTNSQHTWRRVTALNPELASRAHRVVHLGCDAPCAADKGPEQPAKALMLSRLASAEDYKGHREVIAAWPRVLEKAPSTELWIAGDGDLRRALEAQAVALGVQAVVKFWGRVTEEQKQMLLARSSCLVLPSRGEGFGLVYVEAMRLGRPCLVSDADAGQEVINAPEAGLAVDPADAAALAAAMTRLTSPGREWDLWSERARARYERQFTRAHFEARLVEALEQIEPCAA